MKPEARTAKMAIETARRRRPDPPADPPEGQDLADATAGALSRLIAQKVIDDNQPVTGDRP